MNDVAPPKVFSKLSPLRASPENARSTSLFASSSPMEAFPRIAQADGARASRRGYAEAAIRASHEGARRWTPARPPVLRRTQPRQPEETMPDDKIIRDPEGGMARLVEIMRRLRDPETGCPWDVEQDFATIAPYTIEEAHEVADAIERGAWDELKGELGDLLLQAVFHAQIASDRGLFGFDDVVRAISDKLVARHPHVFGDESRDKTAAQQVSDWEDAKAAERAAGAQRGALDGVAKGLPALMRAEKLQKRAARVGFDWPEAGSVIDKIAEEARELKDAAADADPDQVEEEFGDLLFAAANLARHLGVDPETALRRANAKFARRFARIEEMLAETGRSPADSTLEEMDAMWNRAKQEERG